MSSLAGALTPTGSPSKSEPDDVTMDDETEQHEEGMADLFGGEEDDHLQDDDEESVQVSFATLIKRLTLCIALLQKDCRLKSESTGKRWNTKRTTLFRICQKNCKRQMSPFLISQYLGAPPVKYV